jgi:hypothetical protein
MKDSIDPSQQDGPARIGNPGNSGAFSAALKVCAQTGD